ncbi:MAG: hypothetical protein COU22_03465 [Candidatus Komeilibacteria bacterium CG10_big_fil_rev_8_21_14_0_10_41_13]|uniref:3D domain-containing protein n=1 Tax=Candidatus Komeilibacteria bacterium CG10_big_fil_rev_8_21_14_0_10_41_13 TaxID=1974476 RepID=A0A2M6WBM3_9BACT|nr:MAG: hypothetical protein COU22_03465 [Candidatus Komeilibacteria bacterium CG10_big_fil_rev_8_21_14_0_10_41_13]
MLKITRKLKKTLTKGLDNLFPVLLLMAAFNLNFPHLALAQENVKDIPVNQPIQLPYQNGKQEVLRAYVSAVPKLPESGKREPRFILNTWVTSYNSHPSQTDDSPCITASGLDVCERFKEGAEDIVATNFRYLPFGTKIEFPDLYPGKVFIVEDRMNRRYTKTFDIWMSDYQTSREFGRKYTRVYVY